MFLSILLGWECKVSQWKQRPANNTDAQQLWADTGCRQLRGGNAKSSASTREATSRLRKPEQWVQPNMWGEPGAVRENESGRDADAGEPIEAWERGCQAQWQAEQEQDWAGQLEFGVHESAGGNKSLEVKTGEDQRRTPEAIVT